MSVIVSGSRRKGVKLATMLVSPLLVFAGSQAALAQSTGTQAAEGLQEVVVTGRRATSIAGVLEQTAARSRISVSGDFLGNDTPGQTVIESLNLVPGLNFTSNDAYGSSGGNIRLRSFDGSRVSLTFDGLPLNDTGNYSAYTNQLPDSEIIERVDVNLGSTDVDSPTASATGGTIAWRTRKPLNDMGGQASVAMGSEAFRRYFGRFDTGAFGPWNTTAFIAASSTNYDKFKGPGEIYKRQVNARIQQDLNNGDFIAVSLHFNRNRNAQYRSGSEAQYLQFGRQFDNLATCTLDAPTTGVRDDDGATPFASTAALPASENPLNPSACSNYYNNRINPSDTGNIRINSLWNISEKLRLSIDPSVQYTLANGGGRTLINETPAATDADKRLIGLSNAAGFDINGDGDILDRVLLFTPNNTNTRRFGLNASLIWDVADAHRVRFAYTLDYGKHRQTAEWGYFDANGNPENVFAGRQGRRVNTADGSYLRGRDRYSIAELNQVSADYRGKFLDDKLTLNIGVRAPFFKRKLNQYCYSLDGGNGNSGQVNCTTQTPVATRSNGNVVFVNSPTAAQYIAPYSKTLKFEDVLPNVGFTYELDNANSVYATYSAGLSAPRTDNLYSVRRLADGSVGSPIPESETTDTYDFGWRLKTENLLASATVWYANYKNRIASAFDPDLGFSVDRNLGNVKLQGFDSQIGWKANDWMMINASASYSKSELQSDTQGSTASVVFATKGKTLVETPDWTFGARVELTPVTNFSVGLEGKYVGDRFASDLNDYVARHYAVVDLDMGYKFELGNRRSVVARLNISNLFDEQYFGSISSSVGGTAVPFYSLGAPRAIVLSLRTTL